MLRIRLDSRDEEPACEKKCSYWPQIAPGGSCCPVIRVHSSQAASIPAGGRNERLSVLWQTSSRLPCFSTFSLQKCRSFHALFIFCSRRRNAGRIRLVANSGPASAAVVLPKSGKRVLQSFKRRWSRRNEGVDSLSRSGDRNAPPDTT